MAKDNDIAKCLTLIPRIVGDVKSVAKRTASDDGAWPNEIKEFLAYLHTLKDGLEEKFPNNIK